MFPKYEVDNSRLHIPLGSVLLRRPVWVFFVFGVVLFFVIFVEIKLNIT